jgi:hypothetical protein
MARFYSFVVVPDRAVARIGGSLKRFLRDPHYQV